MNASSFFTSEEQSKLLAAINEAEKETSGEIRIHIDTTCREDVLDRAAWMFSKLGMEKTDARNGVLFYLAVKDRKFAILGDSGINARVPSGFWDCISELLSRNFKEGRFTEGLCEGVNLAGKQLRHHFPFKKDDVNELSDELSFGEEGDNK